MKKFPSIWQYLGWAGACSCLSGALGFLALSQIIAAEPFWAIVLIVLATLADCLDGYVARRTKTTSDFGRQLDGMFDFLNYSLFSAVFIHQFILPNSWGLIFGLVIVILGVLRLVRFNVEGFVKKDGVWCYLGMGTTLVMVTLTSGYLFAQFFPPLIYPTLVFTGIIALLQISRVPLKKDANIYILGLPILSAIALLALYCQFS